jgi:hypothetical protein
MPDANFHATIGVMPRNMGDGAMMWLHFPEFIVLNNTINELLVEATTCLPWPLQQCLSAQRRQQSLAEGSRGCQYLQRITTIMHLWSC